MIRAVAKAKADAVELGPVESIKSLDDVAGHDYDAAQAYLSIKLDAEAASKVVKRPHKRQLHGGAPTTSWARRDSRPRLSTIRA
jgi:hypothetical protein